MELALVVTLLIYMELAVVVTLLIYMELAVVVTFLVYIVLALVMTPLIFMELAEIVTFLAVVVTFHDYVELDLSRKCSIVWLFCSKLLLRSFTLIIIDLDIICVQL